MNLQCPLLRTPGLLLERGVIDAEIFVLDPQGLELGLECLIAVGVDFELGIEVALEVFHFAFHPLQIASDCAARGEAGFPEEGGDEQAEEQAPSEWVLQGGDEIIHKEIELRFGGGGRRWFRRGGCWIGGSGRFTGLESSLDTIRQIDGIFVV